MILNCRSKSNARYVRLSFLKDGLNTNAAGSVSLARTGSIRRKKEALPLIQKFLEMKIALAVEMVKAEAN